jgi:hypothetical protein
VRPLEQLPKGIFPVLFGEKLELILFGVVPKAEQTLAKRRIKRGGQLLSIETVARVSQPGRWPDVTSSLSLLLRPSRPPTGRALFWNSCTAIGNFRPRYSAEGLRVNARGGINANPVKKHHFY